MDREYRIYKQEQAVNGFPHLVSVIGYSAAFEELQLQLFGDQLLHPEDAQEISEIAAFSYLESHMPDNIVRGTE